MDEFHYKYVKRNCNANLFFTDTDSLVHENDICLYIETMFI